MLTTAARSLEELPRLRITKLVAALPGLRKGSITALLTVLTIGPWRSVVTALLAASGAKRPVPMATDALTHPAASGSTAFKPSSAASVAAPPIKPKAAS